LLECTLIEDSDDGQKIIEEVNGFKAQKYLLHLKVKVDRNPNKVIIFEDLTENNYLNKDINIIKKRVDINDNDLKANLEGGLHMKNPILKKSINELEKEKKLKAYVWIIENCPINSEEGVKVIESIGPANEFMDKVKEFFEHPDLQKIIKKKRIPY
jgi:hypothetical protein